MVKEDHQHPGLLLQERFLDPLCITPHRLARAIGVRVRRVSELTRGLRALTPDMAHRLGLFFGVPARWWLEMQARFDAHDPERLEELRPIVVPYEGIDKVLVTPTGIVRLEQHPPNKCELAGVRVTEEFSARLRSQAELADRHLDRQPMLVTYEDGTVALTGA